MTGYIIGIDQSTQGTKALLFDRDGRLIRRTDRAHRQLVNEKGWVSHDPEEIYRRMLEAVSEMLIGIEKEHIIGIGISNQRETSLAWNRRTGQPYGHAIVWQCARAADISERAANAGMAEPIRRKTGLNLSPYFPAAKLAWILENAEGAKAASDACDLCLGTMDTYLVWKLTHGKSYKTDYSNASRTQLFDIFGCKWDPEICAAFGINPETLPEVCDSDACYGMTDFDGILPAEVPIHGVMGDSHGALFGQGCRSVGMTKATYGTGSSIMMNIGGHPVLSSHGLVTSLAWGLHGKIEYVLEGNLNYTGAVITWLKDNLGLIASAGETQALAKSAVQDDTLYFVPAFSGLGAPYWDSHATAELTGITRTTGKAEVVRAALECIAYQITDILRAMQEDASLSIPELRVDGGPAKNEYLMQFQSDVAGVSIRVPDTEEMSGMGAAYAAGLALGFWDEKIFGGRDAQYYAPKASAQWRGAKYSGWLRAVQKALNRQ